MLSGFNKSVQIEDMRARVADQELDMDRRIQKLDEDLAAGGGTEKFDRGVKEKIILKRLGYKDKNQAFINIAMNRSKMLTDMANSQDHAEIARKLDPNHADKKKRLKGEAKYAWEDSDEGREQLQRYRQRKFARQTLKGMGLSKVKHDYGTLGKHSGYSQQGAGEKLGMDVGIDIHHQLAKANEGKPVQEATKEKFEKAKREALGTQYAYKRDEAQKTADDQSKGVLRRTGGKIKAAWYDRKDRRELEQRQKAELSLSEHTEEYLKNRRILKDENAGRRSKASAKIKAMWHNSRRGKAAKRLGLDRQEALGIISMRG
jgi:hypothetical protein